LIDLREQVLAQERAWGDLFPNGITANKKSIDWFATHCHEHGIVERIHPYEEIFAPSTLDT
jgi:hypothetical protein